MKQAVIPDLPEGKILDTAGIPDSIYSESHGQNDYTDDYKSRVGYGLIIWPRSAAALK